MKILLILLTLCLTFINEAKSAWSEEGRLREAKQVALWKKNLKEAQSKPDSERIPLLWLGLKNMGYWKGFEEHGSAVDQIYNKLQSEMLSIPGHAQYFADEIEKFRERVQRVPRANQTDYDFFRELKIAHTLMHMPSPETISVLGNYLYDERDTKPERNWTPENAHLAAYALSRIGLRDFQFEGAPVANSLTIWPDLKQLPEYRIWWEEVKSGRRAFSFKGQAVEYRFNSDGTWETIPIANPPDDGLKPVANPTKVNLAKKAETGHRHSPEVSRGIVWWSYGVAGAALLAACVWLMRKKTAE